MAGMVRLSCFGGKSSIYARQKLHLRAQESLAMSVSTRQKGA
jgi:hypothetical protein